MSKNSIKNVSIIYQNDTYGKYFYDAFIKRLTEVKKEKIITFECIYKKELFKENLRYTTIITDDLVNFYTKVLIDNNIDENLMKIIEEPCYKFPGGKETFYYKNGEKKSICKKLAV